MYERICFVASRITPAQEALATLTSRYGNFPADEAEAIVALGGDGFMLQTLHRHMRFRLPVFGMKLGTVGFLMNLYHPNDLLKRMETAVKTVLTPLRMIAHTESGGTMQSLAVNEVSLLRQNKQAAKLKVTVDDVVRVEELVCDGILLSTPVGSTAYNLSAHGPILPLNSDVLALTPISPFRPRRWRGALVPKGAEVLLEVLDHYKRPVSATADANEVRDVIDVTIKGSPADDITLLFDPEHNLEERILSEQFAF